jgi:hypothetical protein
MNLGTSGNGIVYEARINEYNFRFKLQLVLLRCCSCFAYARKVSVSCPNLSLVLVSWLAVHEIMILRDVNRTGLEPCLVTADKLNGFVRSLQTGFHSLEAGWTQKRAAMSN